MIGKLLISLFLLYLALNHMTSSASRFEGTYSVLIPLPAIGKDNQRYANEIIEKEDISHDPTVDVKVETKPHITVHMNLKNDLETLRKVCKEIEPFTIVISGLGMFQTKKTYDGEEHKWDVLWRYVTDGKGQLKSFHEKLVTAFNQKWHFDEYKPHVTIAFLEYGKAEKYVKKGDEKRWFITVDHVIFSKFKDDTEKPVRVDLGK